MKLKKILPLMVGACMAVLLVSCAGSSVSKQAFTVDTGDRIELTIDKGSGFKIEYGSPYLITKDGETYFQGGFGTEDVYDHLMEQVSGDTKATILEEGEKDGSPYMFYVVRDEKDGEDGYKAEYDIVMKVAGGKTCVLLASERSEADAREAFEAMTFTLMG